MDSDTSTEVLSESRLPSELRRSMIEPSDLVLGKARLGAGAYGEVCGW